MSTIKLITHHSKIRRITFYSISWFYSCAAYFVVLITFLPNHKAGQ